MNAAVTLAALGAALLAARAPAPTPPDGYAAIVSRVAGMASDARLRALAARHGLQLLNVLWEDTGRYQGSAVGPNIGRCSGTCSSTRRPPPPISGKPS